MGGDEVQPTRLRIAGRVLWLVTVILIAADLAILTTRSSGRPLGYPGEPWSSLLFDLGDLLFASIGALLISRRPRSAIGWILLAEGLVEGLSQPVSHAGMSLLAADPSSATGATGLLVADALQQLSIGLGAIYLPLLFPDGRFLGPQWRALAVVAGVALVAGAVGSSLIPGPLGNRTVVNPIGLTAFPKVADLLYSIGYAVTLAAITGAAASVVVRYRRADAVGRQQLRWFVSVALGVAFGLVLFYSQWDPMTGGMTGLGTFGLALGLVSYVGLPVAVGIAIVRYRLYQIDVLLTRTAVYVPLIAIVAGLYSAATVLFQRLFIAFTGQTSDAAIVLSTLTLATLFTPIRRSLEGFVDRRFKAASHVPSGPAESRGSDNAAAVAALTREVLQLERAVAALSARLDDAEMQGSMPTVDAPASEALPATE